jgi:hypothetical protein
MGEGGFLQCALCTALQLQQEFTWRGQELTRASDHLLMLQTATGKTRIFGGHLVFPGVPDVPFCTFLILTTAPTTAGGLLCPLLQEASGPGKAVDRDGCWHVGSHMSSLSLLIQLCWCCRLHGHLDQVYCDCARSILPHARERRPKALGGPKSLACDEGQECGQPLRLSSR